MDLSEGLCCRKVPVTEATPRSVSRKGRKCADRHMTNPDCENRVPRSLTWTPLSYLAVRSSLRGGAIREWAVYRLRVKNNQARTVAWARSREPEQGIMANWHIYMCGICCLPQGQVCLHRERLTQGVGL